MCNVVVDFILNSLLSFWMEENSVFEIGWLCGGGFYFGIFMLWGWVILLVLGNDDSVVRDRNFRVISRLNLFIIYVVCLW